VWALFPILYIVSAALNSVGTLQASGLIPREFSTGNFETLLSDESRPYLSWYKNSMIIATIGAAASLFVGAVPPSPSPAAIRRAAPGLLSLLLLQMFPALLAFVAIYITFLKVGETIPAIGFNTIWGLILVYSGGAMGANVWLLKGYFDTVPRELDEAAKMDGASHARSSSRSTCRW
jgi:arabinogalactan oligomer/maltooligosaccharide transport system permease protein